MENNNSQPQGTTQPQPAPIMPNSPSVGANEPPQQDSSSNKMVMWLILGLVVIVLIVGGVYLYLSRQQTAKNLQTNVIQTPAPVAQENLENDLNTIDVGILDQDFSAVDQDLKQL